MTETLEHFDLYDVEGRGLGRAKARGEVHRDGDWHRSTHIWVFTSNARLLFQRRAPDKDTWPGRFDSAIGGHYRAGEDAAAGIAREAREELGIEVAMDELILLGLRRIESLEPGIIDRELQDIYLLRRDLPLTAYIPDPIEIDGLALLDAQEAARLHAGMVSAIEAEVLPRTSAAPERRIITSGDIIPNRGHYLELIARAVTDILAGRMPQRQHLSQPL